MEIKEMKLIVLRGVSGSGKSTFANNPPENTVVVSRDSLRMALFGKWYGIDEDLITKIEHDAVRRAFAAGHDVISDNTNIVQRSVRKLVDIANEFDAEIEIKQFDVDLETAWTRCESRRELTGKEIPRRVLESQYERLRKNPTLKFDTPPKFEKYIPNYGPDVLLCDIDGTLAEMTSRGPFDWKRVGEDRLVEPVRYMLEMAMDSNLKVILLSGRDSVCREETEEWLDNHAVCYDELYMRGEKDSRPDIIVKMELFDKYIRDEYDVVGIIDDRPSVCRQWRKHGIFTFQVGDPHNEF